MWVWKSLESKIFAGPNYWENCVARYEFFKSSEKINEESSRISLPSVNYRLKVLIWSLFLCIKNSGSKPSIGGTWHFQLNGNKNEKKNFQNVLNLPCNIRQKKKKLTRIRIYYLLGYKFYPFFYFNWVLSDQSKLSSINFYPIQHEITMILHLKLKKWYSKLEI